MGCSWPSSLQASESSRCRVAVSEALEPSERQSSVPSARQHWLGSKRGCASVRTLQSLTMSVTAIGASLVRLLDGCKQITTKSSCGERILIKFPSAERVGLTSSYWPCSLYVQVENSRGIQW